MESFEHLIRTLFAVLLDIVTFTRLCLRPTTTVAAENLFLRKQLGLFVERKIKPRRATDSIRFTLVRLPRWFDWRNALIAVKPDTLIRWLDTNLTSSDGLFKSLTVVCSRESIAKI